MGSLDEDVRNQLKEVNTMLGSLEEFCGNLGRQDYEGLTRNMTPEDRAQYDVTIAYAYNSLFWMYLRSQGENPNEHKIKEELDRFKAQMQRLGQIKDKAKRPRVNTEAASRMISHGINEAKNKRKRKVEEENWDEEKQEDTTTTSKKPEGS